jgi:hypothetical protein
MEYADEDDKPGPRQMTMRPNKPTRIDLMDMDRFSTASRATPNMRGGMRGVTFDVDGLD